MHSAPFFEPDPCKGVLDPTLAKNRRKTSSIKTKIVIYSTGLIDTKMCFARFTANFASCATCPGIVGVVSGACVATFFFGIRSCTPVDGGPLFLPFVLLMRVSGSHNDFTSARQVRVNTTLWLEAGWLVFCSSARDEDTRQGLFPSPEVPKLLFQESGPTPLPPALPRGRPGRISPALAGEIRPVWPRERGRGDLGGA